MLSISFMINRARQLILNNYKWDSIAAKMISVYQDITREK